jgi:hypothetical protein
MLPLITRRWQISSGREPHNPIARAPADAELSLVVFASGRRERGFEMRLTRPPEFKAELAEAGRRLDRLF